MLLRNGQCLLSERLNCYATFASLGWGWHEYTHISFVTEGLWSKRMSEIPVPRWVPVFYQPTGFIIIIKCQVWVIMCLHISLTQTQCLSLWNSCGDKFSMPLWKTVNNFLTLSSSWSLSLSTILSHCPLLYLFPVNTIFWNFSLNITENDSLSLCDCLCLSKCFEVLRAFSCIKPHFYGFGIGLLILKCILQNVYLTYIPQ